MIKNSQGNAEKVEIPYKIGVSYISVSKLGYKTPYFIRPVQNPRNWPRTDQNMGLIYQFMRYILNALPSCLGDPPAETNRAYQSPIHGIRCHLHCNYGHEYPKCL
jgi:hypothetical protein